MKRLQLACCIIVCIFLDCIFFGRVNLYGIAPDMLLILTVVFAMRIGGLQAGIIMGSIGLLVDLLLNNMIGITSIAYFTAAIAAGACFKKYYVDYVFVPIVYVVVFSVIKQHLLCIISIAMGSTVNYPVALVTYILPCAIASLLFTVPVHFICKAIFTEKRKTINTPLV